MLPTMNAPELDYITVKGFKSIASVEKLELRPITSLSGLTARASQT